MINGQPAGQPRVHITNHISCSSIPERDRGESDQIWIIIIRVKISLDEILSIASRNRSTACCCPSQYPRFCRDVTSGSMYFFFFFFIWFFFLSWCVLVCVLFSLVSGIFWQWEHTIFRSDLILWKSEQREKNVGHECTGGVKLMCAFSQFTWYILLPAF